MELYFLNLNQKKKRKDRWIMFENSPAANRLSFILELSYFLEGLCAEQKNEISSTGEMIFWT
jgi:hypothetical protein